MLITTGLHMEIWDAFNPRLCTKDEFALMDASQVKLTTERMAR